jgi:SAM-dependent methyltransferase
MTTTGHYGSPGEIALASSPVYTLGSNPAERERLRRQSDDLAAHSVALLSHVDLPPGARALDLGCGPAGAIELLAQRVGATGSVTAVDIDPTHVTLARQLVQDRQLDNVEVLRADARNTGLPSGSFDVVHARLLLVNIPSPEAVVAEMVRLVKPGGWVLTEEADSAAHICYPPHPAWDRLITILHAAYGSDGADVLIGRKLARMLRDGGLADIGVDACADVYPAGHPRRTLIADLVRSMRAKVVQGGLVADAEWARLDHQVREHLSDPETVTMSCLYFLAWGRKPEVGKDRRENGFSLCSLDHLTT